MQVTVHDCDGSRVVVVESGGLVISDARSVLDMLADIGYTYNADRIVLHKTSVADAFFDLKTGLAGEILQKFINYRVKLAIVGDFSAVKSKSLRDFIYECNYGRDIFFLPTVEEAVKKLQSI